MLDFRFFSIFLNTNQTICLEVQSFEELTEFSLVFFRQFTCRLFQSESVDLARCGASLACAGSGPISYDWLWNKNNIIIKAKIVKVKQWTTFGEEYEEEDEGSEGIVGQCKSLSSRKLVNYLKLCLCIGKNCIEWNTRPKGVPWCIFNYVSAICQQIKVRYLKQTNRLGRRESERTRTDERHNLRLALPRPAVCYLSVRDFSCSWRRFPLKIHLNIIWVRFLARLFSASVWHLAKCDDKTSSLISHMAFNELQTRTHTRNYLPIWIINWGKISTRSWDIHK